ncbi:MAG TPA: hypothetical protein VH234_01095 [Candidatus Saccharimonadales bacterium]|jgi:hypothetical protein|nr:hypothetical protein [Candidatus Saccharimonadales bacterium]
MPRPYKKLAGFTVIESLFAFIAVVLVITVGLLVINKANSNQLPKLHAGWKMYRNNQLGLSFNYPDNWRVTAGGVQDKPVSIGIIPSEAIFTNNIKAIQKHLVGSITFNLASSPNALNITGYNNEIIGSKILSTSAKVNGKDYCIITTPDTEHRNSNIVLVTISQCSRTNQTAVPIPFNKMANYTGMILSIKSPGNIPYYEQLPISLSNPDYRTILEIFSSIKF